MTVARLQRKESRHAFASHPSRPGHLVIEPNTNGEKAANVTYSFRLEYDKSVSIGNFKATR